MIEFHLDARSGVPTYLQLVQQVTQALRLGILQPGDQLPTVKEVVGRLAINPNTVLKAYRELDLEGLVEGRRGQGTFVSTSRAARPPRRRQSAQDVVAALDRAGAGCRSRRREPRNALRRHVAASGRLEGRMSGIAVVTDGLGKRYGANWALRDCTLEVPAGSVTALVGPNGAGKTTLLQLAIGLSKPSAGEIRVFGHPPRADAGLVLPRVGLPRAGPSALQGLHDRARR